MLNFVTQTGDAAGSVNYHANAGFAPVEMQVLRLAQSRLERPVAVTTDWLRRLSGQRGGQPLADPRLEALRRHAACLRSGGLGEPQVLRSLGFSAAQLDQIEAMMRPRRQPAGQQRERLLYGTGVALGAASMVGFVAMTGVLLAGH